MLMLWGYILGVPGLIMAFPDYVFIKIIWWTISQNQNK